MFNLSTQEVVLSIEKTPVIVKNKIVYQEYHNFFGNSFLEKIKNDIIILHPGPINRGVEISSEVADSDKAIILDQVENGVAIRMAIIYLLAQKINVNKK